MSRTQKVLIRALDEGLLSAAWGGGSLVYRPDIEVAANQWDIAIAQLEAAKPQMGHIDQVQVWTHCRSAAPLMGNRGLSPAQLERIASILRPHLDSQSTFWWRGCHTFRGRSGKEFAETGAELLGCWHAGHTAQTSSLPFVVFQSGLHVVRPGQAADWPNSEGGKSYPGKPNTVTITKMRIPPRFLR